MLLFLKLLLAHILGDFIFQPEQWVQDKEVKKIKSPKLYFHIGIHSIFLLVLLQFNLKEYWLGFLIIISSHYIFDVFKLYFQKKNTKRTWFFIDQILHLLILFFIVLLYNSFNFYIESFFNSKILLLIISLLMVTNVSAIIIRIFITKWTPENKKEEGKDDEDDSLAKAGRYIGILERLFIFVFIITDHWDAIGFLLAAKSVFRFGDLKESKERKLTEYILIGTLLSFGIAILIGSLYLYVLNLL